MSEIISDGVRSVTGNCNEGFRGNYGNYNGCSGYMDAFIDTKNNWTVDNHGAERTANTIEAVAKSELATEKIGAANSLATEKVAAAATLANALSFSNLQNLLISGFKDNHFDSANTRTTLQAQIAECCCELKEKIGAEGQATRDLINETTRLENAVKLQIANAQLVNNKLPPVV